MLKTALQFSHHLLSECLNEGDTVVDATMGNGHDTLFMAQLLGKKGTIYAFDIQDQAIASTQNRLEKNPVDCTVHLILDGHERLSKHIPSETRVKAAIFNLGYLPKGNKDITTHPDTTISAIQALIPLLEVKGRLILVLYSGHTSGQVEKDAILTFAETLPQDLYSVMTYGFINQKNNPPSILCIEKKEQR